MSFQFKVCLFICSGPQEGVGRTLMEAWSSRSPSSRWMFLRSPISSLTLFCVAALLRPKPKTMFDSSEESCFRNSN